MRQPIRRRPARAHPKRARLTAAVVGIVAVGGAFAVAQTSSAQTRAAGGRQRAAATCPSSGTGSQHRDGDRRHRHLAPNAADPDMDAVNPAPTGSAPAGSAPAGSAANGSAANGSAANGSAAPGGSAVPNAGRASRQPASRTDPCAGGGAAGAASGSAQPGGDDQGLEILGTDCSNSSLAPHNGFQEAPRCVDTAFGEVAAAAKGPSLLITSVPQRVRANQRFTIEVSSRNLVRDRFLAAAAGGYYVERSFLNAQGLQRGHIHTACRMLASTATAPDPAAVPAFFVATEDGGGGAQPDKITIEVSGLPTPGTAQCSVWAGDGSHRMPMMQRANQTPAFDTVRVTVTP